MSDKLITSEHVQKLGHEILEIRERALNNIISKLNHGFNFDNDLARSKEILLKLFQWFLYPQCSYHNEVFDFIKQILQSESGEILINHLGASFILQELMTVRSYIEPHFDSKLDDVIKVVTGRGQTPLVPPLETDIPLSYRTGQSTARNIESTATPIEGRVIKSSSELLKSGQQENITSNRMNDDYLRIYIINPLKWHNLIDSDYFILQSVERTLRQSKDITEVVNSIEFFNNVLINDFPAEIFVQRPSIIKALQDLLYDSSVNLILNSVLNGLLNLVKNLKVRVNHYNDPSMYNSKDQTYSGTDTFRSSTKSCDTVKSSDRGDPNENVSRTNQMSMPQFCSTIIKSLVHCLCIADNTVGIQQTLDQEGKCTALILLNETVHLLGMILSPCIWDETPNSQIIRVLENLNVIQSQFAFAMDYYRVQINCDDTNLIDHAQQLSIYRSCCHFLKQIIPLPQANSILIDNLKTNICNILIDVTLKKLHPDLYKIFLEFADCFSSSMEPDLAMKYKEMNRMCNSITSATQFFKNHQSLDAISAIELAKHSLLFLEYQKQLDFIKYFVEICANRLVFNKNDEDVLKEYEEVVARLLAHNINEIKLEMYQLCWKRIINTVGPKLNDRGTGMPDEHILFLLRTNILTEIAIFGVTNENLEIKNFATDILLHILKCQILVSDDIWQQVLLALLPSLPILLCFADNDTSLGRALFNIMDPDTASNQKIPLIQVIKGNLQILFLKNSNIREEAFMRLSWLLTSQANAKNYLPKSNIIYRKALPNICQVARKFDINKNRNTQHFYQPSSLEQVLNLLKTDNVEPVILRSALTQISVMLEDPLLHWTFLQENGLEILLTIARKALNEDDYSSYPDTIIPIICILKNLCIYQATLRQDLCNDSEIFFLILRALILFNEEERLRSDAACLLFLLIFHDFVIGSPSRLNFSIPCLLTQKLCIPFTSQTHWKKSQYNEESFTNFLLIDKYCNNALEIHWNIENFGLDELLYSSIENLTGNHGNCTLNSSNLNHIKGYSIDYSIEKYLYGIQNSTTPEKIFNNLSEFKLYTYLCDVLENQNIEKILSYPWEITFSKFLKILPSSIVDIKLLSSVLKFLTYLIPLFKKLKWKINWLLKLLKNPSSCLLDLINIENDAPDYLKTVGQNLLGLITVCAYQEQNFFNYFYPFTAYKLNESIEMASWRPCIEIIVNKLKFGDSAHFYNLSYLDSLLSCLAHLTSCLGWTQNFLHSSTILRQLINCLCQMIIMFRNGKGETATSSVMGLSITRHIILVLNHIIAELNYTKMKNWDQYFLDIEEPTWLKCFFILTTSRDVILRAAVLQLFASFAQTARLAMEIIDELKEETPGLLEFGLEILLDQNEASLVREKCALLLAHLISHAYNQNATKTCLYAGLFSKRYQNEKDSVGILYEVLEKHEFFSKIITALGGLYTIRFTDFMSTPFTPLVSQKSEKEDLLIDTEINFIITPSFVRSIIILLNNIYILDNERLSSTLQKNGLVKYLFRSLCGIFVTNIANTKKLSVYCEILEMNIAICTFLNDLARSDRTCLGTTVFTKDCMHTLIGLLNHQNYYINLPALLYLRNRLWVVIYQLLATLTMYEYCDNGGDNSEEEMNAECLALILKVIEEENPQIFLEALCEAVKYIDYEDLQNSALFCLIAIFNIKTSKISNIPEISALLNQFLNIEISYEPSTIRTRSEIVEQTEIDLLRKTIFNESPESKIPSLSQKPSSNFGGIICNILLKLYEANTFSNENKKKKKSLILSALTAILYFNKQSRTIIIEFGLLENIIRQIKEIYLKLSLECVDILRQIQMKKKNIILQDLNELFGLLMNLVTKNEFNIRKRLAELGLPELISKLWDWISINSNCLRNVLKLLYNFTADYQLACQSLCCSGNISVSKITIFQSLINLIDKEMDQISKTHNLDVLYLTFSILINCCIVTDCRILLIKSNLLQGIAKLHPAITKKQKPWDRVEMVWLEFLKKFTSYSEGQNCITKFNDLLDIIISLTRTTRSNNNSFLALQVLRNISFYQPNRVKLLISGNFLETLKNKLEGGNLKERSIIVLMLWSLVANNQKAKIVLKAAQLDNILEQVLKHYEVTIANENLYEEEIQRMRCVLNLIKHTDCGVR